MSRRHPDLFLFYVRDDREVAPKRRLAVHCRTAGFSEDLLLDSLKQTFNEGLPPDEILLLASAAYRERIREIVESEKVADTLIKITRYSDASSIKAMLFSADGNINRLDGRTVNPVYQASILSQGAKAVFDTHNGMLTASKGFHYRKPSGSHSRSFIRAGNVLLRSVEIDFLALSLLRWIPSEIKRIYTDTALINVLGVALVGHLKQLRNPSIDPSVESFSSYEGIDDFEFDYTHDCVALISASTSGRLVGKLLDRHVDLERIITLFYAGREESGGNVLCNLSRIRGYGRSYQPIESFAPETCRICRNEDSTVVKISGDQFLIGETEIRRVLPVVRHLSREIKGALAELVGTSVIRNHFSASEAYEATRSLYIDLTRLLRPEAAGTSFQRNLRNRLQRHVPASLNAIVPVDDEASKELARLVQRFYQQHTAAPAPQIRDGSDRATWEGHDVSGTVMVVAAVAVSGRSLLGISQFLRTVHREGAIKYLVTVARASDDAYWSEVESDLTYGKSPREHELVVVHRVKLPDDQYYNRSPWDEESEYWTKLLEDPELTDEERAIIEPRLDYIASAQSTERKGMIENIFLPRYIETGTSQELTLRRGFVYWKGISDDRYKKGSQSDVYFTVSAVLQGLRSGTLAEEGFLQNEHLRSVLRPTAFVRFNDGVIQASLLRATRRRELDYAQDELLSSEMTEIVGSYLENWRSDRGEAAAEFLLWLAEGKLTLKQEHLQGMVGRLDRQSYPPLLALLYRHLRVLVNLERGED